MMYAKAKTEIEIRMTETQARVLNYLTKNARIILIDMNRPDDPDTLTDTEAVVT